MTELHHQTLAELAAGLRARRFSSVELTRHFLGRIERFNPALNALITVTGEQALAAAARADQAAGSQGRRRSLTGLPIVHKDIFCTDGVLTTCGSRMLSNFVAPYDATVVERLSQAGVITLGKANMDEFAMGSSNETSWYGPVKNPWDLAEGTRRLLGRIGRRSRGAYCSRSNRHRHGRVDPSACSADIVDRAEANLRTRVAIRNDRFRLESRSGRHTDALGRGCCDAAGRDGRIRPARLDQCRCARSGLRCGARSAAGRPEDRPAQGILRERSRSGERQTGARRVEGLRGTGCED